MTYFLTENKSGPESRLGTYTSRHCKHTGPGGNNFHTERVPCFVTCQSNFDIKKQIFCVKKKVDISKMVEFLK